MFICQIFCILLSVAAITSSTSTGPNNSAGITTTTKTTGLPVRTPSPFGRIEAIIEAARANAAAAASALRTSTARSLTTTPEPLQTPPPITGNEGSTGEDSTDEGSIGEGYTDEVVAAALGFWGAGVSIGAAISAAAAAGNTAAVAVLEAAQASGKSREELEDELNDENQDENDNDGQGKFLYNISHYYYHN